jgi:hypothetical protein
MTALDPERAARNERGHNDKVDLGHDREPPKVAVGNVG